MHDWQDKYLKLLALHFSMWCAMYCSERHDATVTINFLAKPKTLGV